MTGAASRLNRVAGRLSGHQRALLVMRAAHRGEDIDPRWRNIDDPAQARVFDRAMGYLNVVNNDLRSALHAIRFHVDRLEESRLLEIIRDGAETVDGECEQKANRRAVLSGRKTKNLTPAEFLFGIAERVRRDLLDDAMTLAAQMAAIDSFVVELGEEFDGEDLRELDLVETTDLIWSKLHQVLKDLGGPAEMPEPDEAVMDQLHEQVRRSFEFFRLAEPALKRPRHPWESGSGTSLERQ